MGDDICWGVVTYCRVRSFSDHRRHTQQCKAVELHHGKNHNKRNPDRCHHSLITQLRRGQPVWHTMLCPFEQDWPKYCPRTRAGQQKITRHRARFFFSSEISFKIDFWIFGKACSQNVDLN